MYAIRSYYGHFYTRIIGAVVDNGTITAVAVDRAEGVGLIKGAVFIDATGDARLTFEAGARTRNNFV